MKMYGNNIFGEDGSYWELTMDGQVRSILTKAAAKRASGRTWAQFKNATGAWQRNTDEVLRLAELAFTKARSEAAASEKFGYYAQLAALKRAVVADKICRALLKSRLNGILVV